MDTSSPTSATIVPFFQGSAIEDPMTTSLSVGDSGILPAPATNVLYIDEYAVKLMPDRDTGTTSPLKLASIVFVMVATLDSTWSIESIALVSFSKSEKSESPLPPPRRPKIPPPELTVKVSAPKPS